MRISRDGPSDTRSALCHVFDVTRGALLFSYTQTCKLVLLNDIIRFVKDITYVSRLVLASGISKLSKMMLASSGRGLVCIEYSNYFYNRCHFCLLYGEGASTISKKE